MPTKNNIPDMESGIRKIRCATVTSTHRTMAIRYRQRFAKNLIASRSTKASSQHFVTSYLAPDVRDHIEERQRRTPETWHITSIDHLVAPRPSALYSLRFSHQGSGAPSMLF